MAFATPNFNRSAHLIPYSSRFYKAGNSAAFVAFKAATEAAYGVQVAYEEIRPDLARITLTCSVLANYLTALRNLFPRCHPYTLEGKNDPDNYPIS